jgi:LPXTG-motif cell wall-anchored protein
MLNRRKAFIGYLVYKIGKPIAKRMMKETAKSAVPGTREGSRRPNTSAIVAGAGAVLGGLLFWRKRRDRSQESPES